MKRISKFMTSMNLGVVLLILFAGISIVGTIVPQESFAPEQVEQLHPIWIFRCGGATNTLSTEPLSRSE